MISFFTTQAICIAYFKFQKILIIIFLLSFLFTAFFFIYNYYNYNLIIVNNHPNQHIKIYIFTHTHIHTKAVPPQLQKGPLYPLLYTYSYTYTGNPCFERIYVHIYCFFIITFNNCNVVILSPKCFIFNIKSNKQYILKFKIKKENKPTIPNP